VKFSNGIIGKPLAFESATPRNFEEIIGKATLPPVKLDGQLFAPLLVVSLCYRYPSFSGIVDGIDNLMEA
jgi:hypothetical protein